MVLGAKQRSLYELTDAISAKDRVRALALLHGLAEQLRCRRGRGHRASLHAGAHLPADAGDSGEECARLARHLAGAVAGIQDAAVRGRRPDPPGAALQEPPRADAGACAWLRAPIWSCARRRPTSGWCWSGWSTTLPANPGRPRHCLHRRSFLSKPEANRIVPNSRVAT